MNLIKRNAAFQPSVAKFFDDFFTRDLSNWSNSHFSRTNTTLPSVNVVETDDDFKVEMAVPGMSKEDFNINLDNETLTISSEREMENTNEGEKYSTREFSYQSFQRSFHLPKSVVDDSKIEATYEDGILKILIPKREEAKALPPRQIAVS